MNKLKGDDSIVASAVEELLRYDAPVQHTARIVPEDQILSGKQLKKGQSIVAVIAAGNRDPQRFADPNRLDLERKDNRHLSFGWAAHFCFGAALARIEGQIAFSRLLTRLGNITQVDQPLEWRENLGLRGLKSLPLQFDGAGTEMESTDRRSQLTPA
jgi:cytochrome P450